MAASTPPPLGNLLRSTPLSLSELPSHPSLSAHQSSPHSLSAFLQAALNEGLTFSEQTIPSTFSGSSTKTAKPASADVLVQKRAIKSAELSAINWTSGYSRAEPPAKYISEGEMWFVRISNHENAAREGTFSFAEADSGLRVNHSENEAAYTPDCYDARLVLEWEDAKTTTLEGFEDVTMRVFEMCHHISPPVIENRAFSTLVVTAKTAGDEGLLVVQMPVDIAKFEGAWYVAQKQTREGVKGDKGRKVVVGVYTSVERVKVQDDGKIKWVMATASDAKGMIPMWMQSMSLPGAITKDVGLFAKFCQERRSGKQAAS